MAQKAELHVGDHVQFLRMSNKSVSLAGKILKIHDDSDCVDVELDGNDGFVETAHAGDVTVVKKATAAEQRATAAEEKREEAAENKRHASDEKKARAAER